ncbi:MAG: FAD-dependent oxidoreductase [Betaproteobacteria bacterium]|nr:FAD-dependent oxidoreductase [Betaproteobacteria bacterium]
MARGAYPLDIHDVSKDLPKAGAVEGGGTDLSRINRSYGIPARCLIPLGVANLTVGAGRACLAPGRGSARGQPVHGDRACGRDHRRAGRVARLLPSDLPIADVQSALRSQNAVIERPAISEW